MLPQKIMVGFIMIATMMAGMNCPAATGGVFQLPARPLAFTGATRQELVAWQARGRAHLAEVLYGNADRMSLVEFKFSFKPQVEFVANGKGYKLYKVKYFATDLIASYALLSIPAGGTNCPAILALHGHESNWGQADTNAFFDPKHPDSFCGYFAERGYAVMFPAILNHSVTKRAEWCLVGAWMAECQRCLDYLAGRADIVDPGRIGCVGLSTGGFLAMLMGALDERIRATVASGCFSTWNYDETAFKCPPACDDEKYSKRPGVHDLDYCDLAGLAAPRALMLMHGRKDMAYSPEFTAVDIDPKWQVKLMDPREMQAALDEARRLYATAGAAANLELYWHPAGHAVDNPAAFVWIDRFLCGTSQKPRHQ